MQSKSPVENEVSESMNRGFGRDVNRSEWLQVDLLEFLATTVDLRIILFQGEETSILADLLVEGCH